jgi:agmatinase
LDTFDRHWKTDIHDSLHFLAPPEAWRQLNEETTAKVVTLRQSPQPWSPGLVTEVNEAGRRLNESLRQQTMALLDRGQIPAVFGGDHSSPFGQMQAVWSQWSSSPSGSLGLLHLDAHHDLRQAYEGFFYSHASIIYNAHQLFEGKVNIYSLGIRDFAHSEWLFGEECRNQFTVYDDLFHGEWLNGRSFSDWLDAFLMPLPGALYLSIDIDGFSPDLCPHTGTPVLGGWSFPAFVQLLRGIVASGRRIVAFDLCEVGVDPQGGEWDLNVGARVLYQLCLATLMSQQGTRR